jgi:hypothetical protein
MPIDEFSWDADAGAFKIAKTADDLKTMAEWQEPGTGAAAAGSSLPPETSTPSTRSGER